MSLRIAHILRRFTFREWGGTENVVWHTVREQQKQGLEPEILCTAALDQPGTEIIDGITIRRFPYRYPYFPMSAAVRLALDKKGGNPYCPELMKRLAGTPYRILHLHAGGRLALYAEQIAARKALPVLMSLHGGSCAIPAQEMQQMLLPLRHRFSYGGILDRLRKIGRLPEEKADILLALSSRETELLRQRFPNKKIICFPNGVDNRPLPEKKASFRKTKGISDNDWLIVCISRIDYQKNQLILISLTDELRKQGIPTHLILAGPVTSDWYHQQILQTIRQLKLEKNVTIIPGLPPDSPELMQIFRQADCFILPSAHEPFGIVALEALDAGLPLIAAATGGLTDFLTDEENALLFPHDSLTALTDCCIKLRNSPSLAEKLIRNGRRTVETYRWPALISRLTAIYQELLHE